MPEGEEGEMYFPPGSVMRLLHELVPGDVLVARDDSPYPVPLTVDQALAPIETGSPVYGVRLINPRPNSPLELVLYPAEHRNALFTVQPGSAEEP